MFNTSTQAVYVLQKLMLKQQTLVGTWELCSFHLVPCSGITESFVFFSHLYSYGLQPPSSCLLCSVIGSRVTMFSFCSPLISTRKVSSYPPLSHDFLSPLPPPTKPYNKPPKNPTKGNRSILSKVSQHLPYDPPPPLLFSTKLSPPLVVTKCHPLL